ncbi:MAG: hypothetical protein L6Q99_09735 [Planctomycetes bacterium]|nr:hypothetical protein [Planctomycetota bacterium]
MNIALLLAYGAYLVLSLAATLWVGRSLYRNGRVFLAEVFRDPEFADAVNRLLLVGFYLVNVGAIALRLSDVRFFGVGAPAADDPVRWVEVVANKFGGTLLILGVLHVVNLGLLTLIRIAGRRSAGGPDARQASDQAATGWLPRTGPVGN